MSFTLAELEATVVTLPYVPASSFTTPDSPVVHRACRYAVNRWMRETRCSLTVASITVSEGDTELDFTATASDFEPACLTGPITIDGSNEIVKHVDYTKILSLRNLGNQTGKPTLVAFRTNSDAQIFPEADDDYTYSVPYWRPKVTFTPGDTGSAVTIPINDTYIGDIALGACAYLMIEFPDRKGDQMMDKFEIALRTAKGQMAAAGIHTIEPYRGFEDNHYPDSFRH